MPVTLRGIYHNLEESEYTVSNKDAVFFFSSVVYRKKFLQGYEKFREQTKKRMNATTRCDDVYNSDMLSDLLYYMEVEKRGFHAYVRGTKTSKESMYLYALARMPHKTSPTWETCKRPKPNKRK